MAFWKKAAPKLEAPELRGEIKDLHRKLHSSLPPLLKLLATIKSYEDSWNHEEEIEFRELESRISQMTDSITDRLFLWAASEHPIESTSYFRLSGAVRTRQTVIDNGWTHEVLVSNPGSEDFVKIPGAEAAKQLPELQAKLAVQKLRDEEERAFRELYREQGTMVLEGVLDKLSELHTQATLLEGDLSILLQKCTPVIDEDRSLYEVQVPELTETQKRVWRRIVG